MSSIIINVASRGGINLRKRGIILVETVFLSNPPPQKKAILFGKYRMHNIVHSWPYMKV